MIETMLTMVKSGKLSAEDMFRLLENSDINASLSVAIFERPELSLFEKVDAVTKRSFLTSEQEKCLESIDWNGVSVRDGKRLLRFVDNSDYLAKLLFETGEYASSYMIKFLEENVVDDYLREAVKKRVNFNRCSIEKLFEYYNLFEHPGDIAKIIIKRLDWENLKIPSNRCSKIAKHLDMYHYLELGEYSHDLLRAAIKTQGFQGKSLVLLAELSKQSDIVLHFGNEMKIGAKYLFEIFKQNPDHLKASYLVGNPEYTVAEKLAMYVLSNNHSSVLRDMADGLEWDGVDDDEAYSICYMFDFKPWLVKTVIENGRLKNRAMELWEKSGYDSWLIYMMAGEKVVGKKDFSEIFKNLNSEKEESDSTGRRNVLRRMIEDFGLSKKQKFIALEASEYDRFAIAAYVENTNLTPGECIDLLEKTKSEYAHKAIKKKFL